MTPASIHDTLFTAVDGYRISAAGKERLGIGVDPAFTYGEATPQAMEVILSLLPHRSGIFYDLGSGTGKAVISAMLLGDFERSVGVELVPELHEVALTIGERFQREIQPSLPWEKQMQRIEFHKADIFQTNFSDGDAILLHCCTCFPEPLMDRLAVKCLEAKRGSFIISISRTLPEAHFEQHAVASCPMGWGTATAYVYRKK